MIVLAFPAEEARRIVEGVQTVATYPHRMLDGMANDEGRRIWWHITELVGQTVAVARLAEPVDSFPSAIVGSVTVAACVPIVDRVEDDDLRSCIEFRVRERSSELCFWPFEAAMPSEWVDLSDQAPFADFSPGRWALVFTDPAPCEQRCPWCSAVGPLDDCPVCEDFNYLDAPIPYTATGPIGEWTP